MSERLGPTARSTPPCLQRVDVRKGRIVDLFIAAVALANCLPLFTRNPDDFRGLDGLVVVVPV